MSNDTKDLSTDDKEQKIQSLRDMINTAEQTMQSAKAMLLQLEGKKKVGRRKKVDESEGNIVQGTFDGQIMIGVDGKQYPIPANYASKSKLVEGDMLKLTITDNGSFIYKQVGPTPRQNKIGIVGQDASGNYFVAVDERPYKVLLASITYFDVQPGDQVAIVTSQEEDAQWASIEALLQHNNNPGAAPAIDALNNIPADSEPKTANEILTGTTEHVTESFTEDTLDDIIDENSNLEEDVQLEVEVPEIDDVAEIMTEQDNVTEEDDDIVATSTSDVISVEDELLEEVAASTEDELIEEIATSVEDELIEEVTASTEDDLAAALPEEDTQKKEDAIIDEWVPDIDEIEKEIRAEMQQSE